MAEADLVHPIPGARNLSPALYSVNLLSGVVGLVQCIEQGSGRLDEKIIALIASVSLIAFAASTALPPRYTTILCRIYFLFSLLACSFLLSPLLPRELFWVPHLACAFPLFHLLQLLPAPLQRSLHLLCCATWTAIRDGAYRAHQAFIRASSSTTSNGHSTAPAHSIEQGDADVVNRNNNDNSSIM